MFVMPLTSMCVMESCERVYLIITLITRYFPFFFVFSFQFFLQLLCTSLVLLIFSYSAQIMLENALLCRRSKIAYSARNSARRIYPSLPTLSLGKTRETSKQP